MPLDWNVQRMNRRGWRNTFIEFVFPEADVSVVKAVKYDAIRLGRLKNESERMEEYLNFKKDSTQKPLQNIQGVQFLFFPIFWAYSYFLLFLN